MGKSLLIQILAAVAISFLGSQTGFIVAWPSNTVAIFASNSTVLSKPMTPVELSLFGSLVMVGALIVSPFCGLVFNKLGRKYACIFFGLPFVLTWSIISLTSNVTLVLIAMALSGIGVAGQAVSPIFISEIAEDHIRGGLSACAGTGYFLGVLISYMIGGYFEYQQVILINLIMAISCLVFFFMLKESPIYLLLKGKEEAAAESIAFYRWKNVSSKEVQIEIAKMKRHVDPNLEKMLTENKEYTSKICEEQIERQIEDGWKSQIKFLKNSKSSKRALLVLITLVFLSILMGSIAVQVYAEPLFKKAVPAIPSNSCAILLAIVFLASSLLCILLIDKCGRKPLMVISSVVSGICTLLLGSQLQFDWAPDWFAACLIYVYSFAYTLGAAIVPFIIVAESFLPEVRDLCNSIVFACNWLGCFICLTVFSVLLEMTGPGILFYVFSVICFICTFYTHRFLPETKGLSVDRIQLAFLNDCK